MSEAANPEGADARSPEAVFDYCDRECHAARKMFVICQVHRAEALLAAESRGAKAASGRIEELERALAWAKRGLHALIGERGGRRGPYANEDWEAARLGLVAATRALAEPAQRPPGSPSVPAAQPKDQANQGAAAHAPDPLRRLSPEELAAAPRITKEQVEAALEEGRKDREAMQDEHDKQKPPGRWT